MTKHEHSIEFRSNAMKIKDLP